MAFNRAGFTQAAKAAGYSDDEINTIATMKEAQASSPKEQLQGIQLEQSQLNLAQDKQNNELNGTLARSKAEQQIRNLEFEKNASTMPLSLKYDENVSAIQQMQDAMNQDFKSTGGKRGSDIKNFYNPYVASEQSGITKKIDDKLRAKNQVVSLDSVATSLDELKDLAAKYNIFDAGLSKVRLSPAQQIFDQKKALVGQQIAKLSEYGKTSGGRGLSDKDREFYQNKVMGGVNMVGLQGNISDVIDSLKHDIVKTSGYDPSLFDKKEDASKTDTKGTQKKIGKYSVVIE